MCSADPHHHPQPGSKTTQVPGGNPLQTRRCDADITLVSLEKKAVLT
jgi:hypothetical protein